MLRTRSMRLGVALELEIAVRIEQFQQHAACAATTFALLVVGLSTITGSRNNTSGSNAPAVDERRDDFRARAMQNYEYQIDEWLPKCPLTLFRPDPPYSSETHYDGEIVNGPADVCNNEHLRRGMQNVYRWGAGVVMDVFVMADGEPPDRHATKLGGLPYRPADNPWPVNAAGEPLLFIAQFNFTDSIDLVGDLPADLLLVFADWKDGFPESLHFEWQSPTSSRLIALHEIPVHPGKFEPCYGYRHRTMNFPDAERDDLPNHPRCRGKDVWGDFHVPCFQATQIGRAPFWIQGVDEDLPGHIICTISSVQPAPEKPHPWVNHASPIDLRSLLKDNHLMIGDMGCLYISIDELGRLHWCEQSY